MRVFVRRPFLYDCCELMKENGATERGGRSRKVRCCGLFVSPPTLFSSSSSSIVTTAMPPRPNARVLRDIKARQGVLDNEIARRAYLYVARNQTLPAQVRYRAQLQLNTFGRYTRPTTVKNRCTVSGRGRGVMGEFGLCRVCLFLFFFLVFGFGLGRGR